MKRDASTPGDPKTSFGPEMPLSERVPPLSFFPTTAACSAPHPAGLLHPATGHGVRLVLCHIAPFDAGALLQTRYPSKLSPLWQHGFGQGPEGLAPEVVALPPLLAARFVLPRALPSAQPQGFAPPESPLRTRDVAASSCPMLPWAYDWHTRLRNTEPKPGRRAPLRASIPFHEPRSMGGRSLTQAAVRRPRASLPPAGREASLSSRRRKRVPDVHVKDRFRRSKSSW